MTSGFNLGIRALINPYRLIIYTHAVSTLRVFPGVGVPGSLRLVGVLTMVPYSRSSSVCFTFFICCTVNLMSETNIQNKIHVRSSHFKKDVFIPVPVFLSLSPCGVDSTGLPHIAGMAARSHETL